MDPVIILILTTIGLICGAIIYLAYLKIPHKVKGLEKIEEISNTLPGINCGACGFAGCFAYAQALSKNTSLITESPCAVTLQNPEAVSNLEKALNIKLDSAAFNKKAIKTLLPHLKSQNFEIETEIFLKALDLGLVVKEVPSTEFIRKNGQSNLNSFRDGFKILMKIAEEFVNSLSKRDR